MSWQIADRIQETTTTTGTGSFALGGAVTNYRTFSSVMSSGDYTIYAAVDSTNNAWEVGQGTYNSSGDLLLRTSVWQSSSGTTGLVNFSVGTKNIFCDQAASFNGIPPNWNNLTAQGTVQSGALPLPGLINVFTTVAAGSGAILLAPGVTYLPITSINYTANTLTVYPQVSGQIGNAGQNSGVPLFASAVARYYPISSSQWIAG